MREILFRGKTEDERWVFGDLTYLDKKLFIEYGIYVNLIISETMGQFTGLLDKNGVKIFEGDAVKITNADGFCQTVIVEYKTTPQAAFVGKYVDKYCVSILLCPDEDEFEVLDNIFDNPGLLEG